MSRWILTVGNTALQIRSTGTLHTTSKNESPVLYFSYSVYAVQHTLNQLISNMSKTTPCINLVKNKVPVAVSSRPKTVVTQQLPKKETSQTDLVSDWIILLSVHVRSIEDPPLELRRGAIND